MTVKPRQSLLLIKTVSLFTLPKLHLTTYKKHYLKTNNCMPNFGAELTWQNRSIIFGMGCTQAGTEDKDAP